jgi:hypothetical protein
LRLGKPGREARNRGSIENYWDYPKISPEPQFLKLEFEAWKTGARGEKPGFY